MRKTFYLLLLAAPLLFFACNNSQAEGTKNSDNDMGTTIDNGEQDIKDLLNAFFGEYKAYLSQKDEAIALYQKDKATYVDQYFTFLADGSNPTFSHLSDDFIAQLRKGLNECTSDASIPASLRSCAEPIFQCGEKATKMEIIAVDAEEGEAVVHATVSGNSGQGCKVIFTLLNIDDRWMITERDAEKVAMPQLSFEYYGDYMRKNATDYYQIYKKDGVIKLDHCKGDDCNTRGIIQGYQKDGDELKLMLKDQAAGEMVPNWSIKGTTIKAFDYDAENDKWFNAEYEQAESAG